MGFEHLVVYLTDYNDKLLPSQDHKHTIAFCITAKAGLYTYASAFLNGIISYHVRNRKTTLYYFTIAKREHLSRIGIENNSSFV